MKSGGRLAAEFNTETFDIKTVFIFYSNWELDIFEKIYEEKIITKLKFYTTMKFPILILLFLSFYSFFNISLSILKNISKSFFFFSFPDFFFFFFSLSISLYLSLCLTLFTCQFFFLSGTYKHVDTYFAPVGYSKQASSERFLIEL